MKPIICPFKHAGRFCTYNGNRNLTKNGKRVKCIYHKLNCPFLKEIKEEKDVIHKSL